MGDRSTIKDVFIQCQTGLQGHGKLIKTLGKIYEKTEIADFWPQFLHCLKYALIIWKREPAVERIIDFVSKFVPSLSKAKKHTDEEGEDEEEEADSLEDNQLLQELFDFLLRSHSARDRAVRFRCCQLVNKLLVNLGEDAQIDDDLYDRLYECMLERLKDKCPMVRYHAVLAMARLQDPTDENCPVIKAYLFLLNCDPNADVRRAVLMSIAPSTKTLASIVGRTRDVKESVRKTAYEVLAEKIHVKAMSIALRLQLMSDGLKDRSEVVKQACSGKVLQTWLRTFNGSILDILKSLDVEDSTDVCSNILETLFKSFTDQDIVDGFVKLLNSENTLVPTEELTSEVALYWQIVCKHIHSLGTEGEVYLEKVLPSCVEFCAYVQRYVEELKNIEDPEIQLGREFIIEQLLLIASYMDTADQASRKAVEVLLHNMLIADHVSHRLVKPIVQRICELRGTGEGIVPYFAETVSDIREPITLVEKDVEAEQKRQINLKMAGIRVNLNQLKEDLDAAVKEQDFTKAAEIKASIAELDAEKAQLLEASEPAQEEIRTERNDPLTLLKCQTIICEMLQNLKLNNVSSTLQMLIESQMVPGVQNADADVRSKAMQALGLCCYLNKDLLVTYIPLFMQASQIDVEGVRVTALQIMFDLLLIYGLEIVDASESSSSAENTDAEGNSTDVTSVDDSASVASKSDNRNGTASKLVAIICSFLDGDSTELRTCAAEGLAKLLLSGRVVSSKILSHLILLWYNPLSEDDTHLRDCLGTFFPLYALAGRSNQEVVEDAFIPTLRTLLNAPATSPLIEVNVNNVAELLVQLSNSKLISQNQNTEASQDNIGHDNLSEKVSNEILSEPDSPNVKLWVKILNQMQVSPDNEMVLKDLRVLCYRMLKVVKDKMCIKNLEKFQATINELVGKFLTGNDDLELIVTEPEPEEQSEATEQEPHTPKRKKVRGLYSQNMTLGMESESELDVTEDTIADVDASCLMSRTSTSCDTPGRRERKNTTTELTADDVFVIPEVPAARKRTSFEEISNEDDGGDTEMANNEIEDDTAETTAAAKSPRKSRSPARAEKTSTESPRKSSKSPTKSPQKSPRGSASPSKKSPEKATKASVSEKSPQKSDKAAEKDQQKAKSPEKGSKAGKMSGKPSEKASKSPEKTSKKLPEKPAKSKSQTSSSKSPEKSPKKSDAVKSPVNRKSRSAERRSSKSPTKTSEESRSPSKKSESASPAKRKASKSPVSGTAAKKSRSRSAGPKSPSQAKSPQQNVSRASRLDKGRKSSEKRMASKSPEGNAKKISRSRSTNKSGKSDQKAAAEKKKNAEKSPAKVVGRSRGNEKGQDPGKQSPRKAAAGATKPANKPLTEVGKRTMTKSPRTVAKEDGKRAKVVLNKVDEKVGKPLRNTRTAPSKNAPSPAGNTRTAPKKAATASTASPRNAPRATKTVLDTPDSQTSRVSRASVRSAVNTPEGTKSVAETPSPRNARAVRQKQPTDTPDSQTSRVSKASIRSAVKTPDISSSIAETPSPRNARPARQKEATGTPSSTASPALRQTRASPAVVAPRLSARKQAPKPTKSGGSATDSSSESPLKKPKKNISKKPAAKSAAIGAPASSQTSTESDSEEDQIVRRARPSRKNVRAPASTPGQPASQPPADKELSASARRSARGGIPMASPATSTLSTPRGSGSLTRSNRGIPMASPATSTLSTPRGSGSLTRSNSKRVEGSSQRSAAKRTPRSTATDSDGVFSSPASVSSVTRTSSRQAALTRSGLKSGKSDDPTKQNLDKKLGAGAKGTENTSKPKRPLRSKPSDRK